MNRGDRSLFFGRPYLRALYCGECGEQTWMWSTIHGPEVCLSCRYYARFRDGRAHDAVKAGARGVAAAGSLPTTKGAEAPSA